MCSLYSFNIETHFPVSLYIFVLNVIHPSSAATLTFMLFSAFAFNILPSLLLVILRLHSYEKNLGITVVPNCRLQIPGAPTTSAVHSPAYPGSTGGPCKTSARALCLSTYPCLIFVENTHKNNLAG